MLGKACSSLVNEPPVNVSGEVLAEMRAKHPPARPDEAARAAELRAVSGRAAAAVDPEDVEKAIRFFPRGSGAGYTGLRPQHLKDALTIG